MMLNAMLYIRDPYPFCYDERVAIEEALFSVYKARSIVYYYEKSIDRVMVEEATLTTCQQIANTLKVLHRQYAIQDKKRAGYIFCSNLEIDIRGRGDARPDWAIL